MDEHLARNDDADDTDAGYRDTLEEQAYEDAAAGADHDAQRDEPDEDEDELGKS